MGHNCVFDGINKIISISSNVSTISVKRDIYSAAKEWIRLRENGKFLAPIRVSGGDPITETQSTGDVYFLINGWRLQISHSCTIDGVLYSDDYPSPFIQTNDTALVTNKVSALVQTVSTGAGTMTPEEFWNFLLSTPMDPGSAGEKLKQVLTTGNFLALK